MLHFTVTLTSSADIVCPGNTVVFTCITDTGVLAWEINGNNHVFLPGENTAALLGNTIMIVANLTRLIGNVTVSTATAPNTHIDLNGSVIICRDAIIANSDSKNKTIQVSGIIIHDLHILRIITEFD